MADPVGQRHSARSQKRPVPSCGSMKSDHSKEGDLPKFSTEPMPSGLKSNFPQDQSMCGVCEQVLRDPVITTTCGHSFCRLCLSSYSEEPGPPGDQACPQCGKKPRSLVSLQASINDEVAESSRHQRTVKDTDHEVLKSVKESHKASLRRRFENISEGVNKTVTPIRLNEIYTELYITKGETEEVNREHEVWQVESASRVQTTDDTPINVNDIFKSLPGQRKQIRSVMTKGVAGIGKTVSVQKFILDWIDGVANQNIDFIFPLPFRELNLVRGDKYSLHSLLLDFHPDLKKLKDGEEYKDCQIVFVFDGLDESRLHLNCQNSTVSEIKQASSMEVLITSLIQGSLLPSAHIWITSRPGAAGQIPAQYIDQVTEVRGFNDPQKEEYFSKRISDKSQANRIISHVKASRSLHIMCHIPVFCWITASVLQPMLKQDSQEIPKTLTGMFIHFLLIQTTRKDQKYQNRMQDNEEQLLKSQRITILKLAELAFKNLGNGNLMFYEQDLRECGIDVREATVFSGMCTEIFREESVFNQRKVYCFVHLSIQEFLAALYVFVSYSNMIKDTGTLSLVSLGDLLKCTVTKALESRNGHLDLFLRFLMGICLETNQRLLQGLLNHITSSSADINEICQHIKGLNREGLSPERCINLFHCLLEMKDHTMYEEIQEYLRSSKGFQNKIAPAQCSALAHMLLMSEEVLDEFDLKKYNTSDEGRRRLIPAVRCFRTAHLDRCRLNEMSCCETVKRCLQSSNSLIHLDLSCNPLGDSGVLSLYAGLTSPQCKLQTLRLGNCNLSDKFCEIAASFLQSANSLIELDLSHNDLGDSGVQHLSNGLSDSCFCKLQILRLSGCLISGKGCDYLASALTSNPSHLKELDLSYNHPGESGLKLLSATVKDKLIKADQCAVIRLRPGLQKYACELILDPNTANKYLSLSERNRKVTCESDEQPYPDHPERFDRCNQVLCREGLSEYCYWEAEWSGGGARIAMVYKGIERKEGSYGSRLGRNANSWSLYCSPYSYNVWHNNEVIDIPVPSSRRIGVYLDWLAGTLSFYSVSSDTLTHLHTFHSTFTEPLYPGFRVYYDSSVSICQIT